MGLAIALKKCSHIEKFHMLLTHHECMKKCTKMELFTRKNFKLYFYREPLKNVVFSLAIHGNMPEKLIDLITIATFNLNC